MEFHYVIQVAFGWENVHLFKFIDKEYNNEMRISIPFEEDWFDPYYAEDVCNASKLKLKDIFNNIGQKFIYIYDFGDNWVHNITLEDIIDKEQEKAICIVGKGACPLEDCGGVWGYEDIKKIFETAPNSKKANNYRQWLGFKEDEIWGSKIFNIEETNIYLKKL